MATESVAATPTAPSDVGLKREMGLIGATWASETSIIGSGWLFGALFAVQAAGPIALLGWVIGGIAVIFLALVHAELGGMYPVSGGTARFPHLAYGSVAGISFGFFSWVQAITVAPIECFAVMQYGSYYWHGLFDVTANGGKGNVTGLGFAMTVVLLVIFTALNFLAMRTFSKINSGITWWKVAIPVITIIIMLFKFHGGNFTAGGGFNPYGWKALFAAIPSAGIIFAYLGFEQADQLAAEIKDPQKNLPRAILLATFIGIVIYCMLQVAFIGAMPSSQLTHGWAHISNANILAGPFAGLAGVVGLSALAVVLRIDAFVSPFGTGLMYQTSSSRVGYGLGRNRYFPQVFTRVNAAGIPWISLLVAFVAGLFFLLPFPSWHSLVSLVTGASVLMYAGAPLAMGAFRRQVPEADRPYRVPAGGVIAPLAFVIANMLIVLVRLRDGLEARRSDRDRVRADRHLHGVRREPPAAGLEVGAVAAVLPGRLGHHLLAGPVRPGQHVPDPVLVGHAGRGRVQPGHLLLGDGYPAAQGRDAQPGRAAVRYRAARADRSLTA